MPQADIFNFCYNNIFFSFWFLFIYVLLMRLGYNVFLNIFVLSGGFIDFIFLQINLNITRNFFIGFLYNSVVLDATEVEYIMFIFRDYFSDISISLINNFYYMFTPELFNKNLPCNTIYFF